MAYSGWFDYQEVILKDATETKSLSKMRTKSQSYH